MSVYYRVFVNGPRKTRLLEGIYTTKDAALTAAIDCSNRRPVVELWDVRPDGSDVFVHVVDRG